MTTAVIVILAVFVAIQSLIIHRKDKKIDALEYTVEFNLKELQKNKREWAEESPIELLRRAETKLRSSAYLTTEEQAYITSTCRSYAASIMRIK